MNYLFQRADNINENERKNRLVKAGTDQGGGALLASARVPAPTGGPQIFGASRIFRAPCFSERRPHCTLLVGHITYVTGRRAPRFNIKYELIFLSCCVTLRRPNELLFICCADALYC